MTPRKPRGPPSRRIAEHRLQGFQASSLPSLPLGSVTIHHFLTEPVFNKILDDFLSQVYPVLPLVHIPSFLNHRAERRFETDPRFFRLCLALCAVTVASIPRSVSGYRCARSCSWYTGAADMVERASQLVLLSRLSSDPGWQDSPSADSLLVSALMAMACHYAGKPVAGWGYASEAVHLFREMELYSKATYREMDVVNGEICKRLFWLLTIIQV